MYVPPKLHSRKPELSSAILRPSGATGEPTSDKERVPSGSLSARSSSLACGSSSRTHHPVVASPRLSRTAQITTQSECIGRLSCVQPAERLARCAFLHACAKSGPHTQGVCSMLTRSTESSKNGTSWCLSYANVCVSVVGQRERNEEGNRYVGGPEERLGVS